MKKSKKSIHKKTILQCLGMAIGITAIYLSIRNIQYDKFIESLKSMDLFWLPFIVVGNFLVIGIKSFRWQVILSSIKKISFSLIFRILTISFMANNILPARLGEAVRIYIFGKDASVSKITTTATVITDKIVETISFLLLAGILCIITDVPKWMHSGLIITLFLTLFVYIVTIIYSYRRIENKYLKKFQDGIKSLFSIKIFLSTIGISLVSWFFQGFLIYMTQLAFNVTTPIWGIILVLLVINLAIAIPSTPSHIGTFEFAAILAYAFLGIDKSVGLLIGLTYHLLQIIPVTLAGLIILLARQVRISRKKLLTGDLDRAYPSVSQ